MKTRLVVWGLVLGLLGLFLHAMNWQVGYMLRMAKIQVACGMAEYCKHVRDPAGALPPYDIVKFEHYMSHIEQESGVDLRFVFVNGTGEQTLEELAAGIVQDERIGGRTGDDRGLLLLYDVPARRLKIEVGYGLEGIFPDAFINYLVNSHARPFLEAQDHSVGLRLLLRLLQARIRDEVLGETFDPRVLSFIDKGRHLSGGAGVATRVDKKSWQRRQFSAEERARYKAGDTPEATYRLYLDWLAQTTYDGKVDFFTFQSRDYISRLPLSPAYADLILMGEYGKRYTIVERGNLAVLYFTGTPFVSPHFFERENGKWRIDIVAEVRNTREYVGTYFTWAYIGGSDPYTETFADLLMPWGSTGLSRFRDGDNRRLELSSAKR
jgi:uncharacterized protein